MVYQRVNQIHTKAAMHAGLKVMLFHNASREIHALGAFALIADANFELLLIEQEDDLD
jgi:hypothetical protein